MLNCKCNPELLDDHFSSFASLAFLYLYPAALSSSNVLGYCFFTKDILFSKIKPLRVLVGLSGGVDSSVTALLLKRAGFDVRCVFMRNWDPLDELGKDSTDSGEGGCKQQKEDWTSAELVARRLSVPLHSVDFSREYWNQVFTPFLSGLKNGVTPNPDVNCNRFVKFGAFKQFAIEEMGADCIATGHYAQISPPIINPFCALPTEHISEEVPLPRLFSSIDATKDQSDFLSMVKARDLRRVILPLGAYTKQHVRSIAMKAGLTTARRKDSYGICFVGKRPFADFIRGYLPPLKCAKFIDVSTGEEVEGRGGETTFRDTSHQSSSSSRQPVNIETLTIGQCAKIPGAKFKWYVCATRFGNKEVGGNNEYNVAWVANRENHPALFSTTAAVSVRDFNFISRPSLDSTCSTSALARAIKYANERRISSDSTLPTMESVPFYSQDIKPCQNNEKHNRTFVDELSEWLRYNRKEPSSYLTERVPSIRVAFRDRHKHEEDLNFADATIVHEKEWAETCSRLLRLHPPRPIVSHNFQEKREFRWINESNLSMISSDDDSLLTPPTTNAQTDINTNSGLVLVLRFDNPRRAVTKGQVLVLYNPSSQNDNTASGIVKMGIKSDDSFFHSVDSKNENNNDNDKNTDNDDVDKRLWRGAGLECIGGGPILAVGPSMFNMNISSEMLG